LPSGREQYLQALASLTDMTRTQAERIAGMLARQGEVQSGQVGRVAEDLLRRTRKNRETVSRLIQREVKRQLGVLGIASRDEVARLQQRIRALEQEAERSSSHPSRPAASSRAAGARTRSPRSSGGAGRPTRSRGGGSSGGGEG
jgi:polyhydroxyalkanoate synthesis regulator phasin